MKKKQTVLLLASLLVLGLWVGFKIYDHYHAPEDNLPNLLMVDGVLYQMDLEVGNYIGRQPDGTLTTVMENGIPRQNGQANFGQNGMPYWHHQNDILVMVNDKCFLFEEADIQE